MLMSNVSILATIRMRVPHAALAIIGGLATRARRTSMVALLAFATMMGASVTTGTANAAECYRCCIGQACCSGCVSAGNCLVEVMSAGPRGCSAGPGSYCYFYDFGPCSL